MDATENTEVAAQPTQAEQDQRAIKLLTALTTMALIGLSGLAFAVGAPALFMAGRDWVGLPGWMPALVPATVDLGIVLLALGSMTARALRLRTWPTNVGVGVLVAVSIAVQVAHVATIGNGQLETFVGQILAALFPATLWLAASTVERIRFSATVTRMAATPARRRQSAGQKPAVASRPAPARSVTATVSASRPVIDPAVRAEAVAMVKAGSSQRTVASQFGISRGALQNYLAAESL